MLLLFLLFVVADCGNAQSTANLSLQPFNDFCITPKNNSGRCVNIDKCGELVAILKGSRPLPDESLKLLLESQCGFDGKMPKVCCPIKAPEVPDVNTKTVEEPLRKIDPPDVTNHPNLVLLNHDNCGPINDRRIYGGNKTGVFEYPWMALLAYDTGGGVEFRCGGTLINKRYILTAAHCVTALPGGLRLVGVRVGDHDHSTERDCDHNVKGDEIECAERYQDYLVEDIAVHPEFMKPTKLLNDIALIRLNMDVDLRPLNVQPICLPIGSAATITQKKVVVTGWGLTELGVRSQALLMVKLSPVDLDKCIETYKGIVQIWYKQMCAGGHKSMDSCHGDSGGPLQAPTIYNNDIRYVQYGIVSFGPQNCGIEGVPGVYTTVSYYVKWILDTIRP